MVADPRLPMEQGAVRDVQGPEGAYAGWDPEHGYDGGCRPVVEYSGYTWDHLPEG